MKIRVFTSWSDPVDFDSLDQSRDYWRAAVGKVERSWNHSALRSVVRNDGSLVLPGDADYQRLEY